MIKGRSHTKFLFLSLLMAALLLVGLVGCRAQKPEEQDPDTKPKTEQSEGKEADKKSKDKGESNEIVAGTIDTSSKYSFEVEGAFVGMDEYSDEPVVILVCKFTNNSDETVSFESALDAKASQGGRELSNAYLQGASDFNWENIPAGESQPVLIGWRLKSGTNPVEIAVIDRYHYAKEEIFSQSYTIDELIANSEAFAREFGGIIDEDAELIV